MKTSEQQVLDLRAEMKRRINTTARLLRAFKKQGELNTAQLAMIAGTGCSSRLHELRREGHIIKAVYERPGEYRYVYQGEKSE